jgi:hypothetical protein
MPTLEELIAAVNAQTPTVELVEPETIGWSLDGPPFEAPETLPPGRQLTVAWLWSALWRELLADPTAAELKARAAAHEQAYPESCEARYRRENSNWLAEKLAGYIEYNSEYRWRRVEQLLDATGRAEHGWRRPDQQRIAWLKANETTIRRVIEKAKAAHYRRYGSR